LAYVRSMLARGLVGSPCLELGAGLDNHNLRSELEARGVDWYGSDVQGDGGRVVPLDFDSDGPSDLDGRKFASVLCLNVIEHTFDPVRVMDRALSLVTPGGTLMVVTPTIWELHYFPLDCWRMNPGFLREYAKRRAMEMVPDTFQWVTPRFEPVTGDQPHLPRNRGLRLIGEKIGVRAMHTLGLGPMRTACLSIGAVLRKP
jgi:SAM-dependent methyltransferase